jgi:hypothetical protein
VYMFAIYKKQSKPHCGAVGLLFRWIGKRLYSNR